MIFCLKLPQMTDMKTKKRILVVDDDIDVLSVAETILENEEYEIFTALNKEDGLKIARSVRPDLAILDVIMDEPFSGFELAEALLKDKEFKGIRVIMQTSLRIFEATDDEMMKLARYYRQKQGEKELDVLMMMDYRTGKAGIDYRDASGNFHWLELDGIIKKPLTAVSLIQAALVLKTDKKCQEYRKETNF